MTRSSKTPPHSLRAAFEQDKETALTRHRRGVERVAELMNVPPHLLYKWLESGRMPASALASWEHATGGDAVVRFIAAAGHRVLIDIPSGRRLQASDVLGLQSILADAVAALLAFHGGRQEMDATLAKLHDAMAALAWHREAVRKSDQPELEFE